MSQKIPGQRHAGFVVQANDNKLWLYDLAWHDTLRQTQLNLGYAYVLEDFLDQYSAAAITAFLANVYHANKERAPYSIVWDTNEQYFDKGTGKSLKTAPGEGLTCATFVLEVLKRYGFDLLDAKTWPITEQNAQWQKSILQKLIDSQPKSIDDFLTQFSHIGKVPRFMPEEVLGAASYYEDSPLSFDVVSSASREIVNELQRLGLD